VSYPDGRRREEITDDKVFVRPDGGREEIKTDQIITNQESIL
jgi:hypothetical protein